MAASTSLSSTAADELSRLSVARLRLLIMRAASKADEADAGGDIQGAATYREVANEAAAIIAGRYKLAAVRELIGDIAAIESALDSAGI
jgi:hypothetical protein